ncbi:MAG TPA: spermidine synthase [Thermoanaerobaculia bacterium]
MLPWKLLDTATIPGDGGEMRLHRRGDEFSIRVENYELMNSRVHGSEDALASLVCPRVPPNGRVLIGGLGMGYTLLAMLEGLGPKAEVVVAELVPAVVQWHRGPLAQVSKGALDDPRTVIREADVVRVIGEGTWDAIALDVDNGPRALTAKGNDRLYDERGLRAIMAALRPKGVLAIWSAGPDAAFTRRLRKLGFAVEEKRVRGFLIWLATRS